MEWSAFCATLVFATILLSPVEGTGNLGRPTLKPNATGHLIPKGLTRNGCLSEGHHVIPVGTTVCITSPGYPGRYANNADSTWTIDNEDLNGTLSVSCNPFKVRSRKCKQDYLVVDYFGFSRRYCGRRKPGNFETSTFWLDLNFVSNKRRNSKGFYCSVTALGSTTTPDCECGLANIDRIVGGVPSGVNEYPWLVGLVDLSENNSTNKPFCGGSVYNNEWIITAAHCVPEGTIPSNIKVVLGMYNWETNSPTPTSRNVSKIIPHQNYDPISVDNDIALIRLSSPVTFSSSIRPVCLPPPSSDYTGHNLTATVTGWGKQSSDSTVDDQPAMAHEVQVTIRSQQECIDAYLPGDITSNMICAGVDSFDKDGCQGDSGGPLTVPVFGQHILAGIVSWGEGCALEPYYGVYTDVPNYIMWIESNAGTTCTA